MTTPNDTAERSASCSGSARPTPGPWRASNTRPFDVYSGDGRYIGTTKGNHVLPEHIADEDKANARLIAAAPCMLAALLRQQANIQRWLDTGVPADAAESESISRQIDEAIKKAIGT